MVPPSNLKLYRDFHAVYRSAHLHKSHRTCDIEVGEHWNKLKKLDNFPENVREEIKKLKEKVAKSRSTLDKFWKGIPPKKPKASSDVEKITVTPASTPEITDVDEAPTSEENSTDISLKVCPTPGQDIIRKKISSLTLEINYLTNKKQKDLASESELGLLKKYKTEVLDLQKKLKDRIGSQARQRKRRANERKLLQNNPDIAQRLKRRNKIGRPSVESDQPELLKTIINIASYGAAAHERRRSETVRFVKTLDELTEELQCLGFNISRSGVYLRLIPKRWNSTEGKRHVTTTPVRLIRATNDAHKHHADTMFCKATIGYLEEIASTLGPTNTLFISQDDKARVPLGKTAANKQAPLVMHMDYRIRLPDHDWVVAEKHKLIPSVYGIMEIKAGNIADPKAVAYTGPTFVAIRSGKHCSSTALSHARDFETLINRSEFVEFTRTSNGCVKPVVVLTVDGGPDENPRYEKVINSAMVHFKKYDLDALFIATNAPGRSAFNRVERRMASLSNELCGLILPHDHFGSHLDSQGKTIDKNLEKRNFEHAGEVLAEIWSNVVFDGFPTVGIYVHPESSDAIHETTTIEWRNAHIRESHYFLQITKCNNRDCCKSPRSPYFNFFPRFLPAPLSLEQNTLEPTDNSDERNKFTSLMVRLQIRDDNLKVNGREIPFDICCPSVKELLVSRTCKRCGIYFASVKSLKLHKKVCRGNPTLDSDGPGTQLLARTNNRPVKIAATRQKERMIVWTSRLNDPHCDWFDDDEIQGVEVAEEPAMDPSGNIATIDIQTYMTPHWETVDAADKT